MVLMGAVAGAGLGLGVLILALGLRGTPPSPTPMHRGRPGGAGQRALARTAAGAAVALGVLAVTGWPVAALLCGLTAVLVPAVLARRRAEAQATTRTEAVAAWTETLRDTLAAAAGLEEAVAASAAAAPEAIHGEVTRLARRLHHARLADALEAFAAEVASPAADLVVAALVTAARREARELVPLLSALADSARAEAEMRRRVEVSRVRIRTAARVVTATLAVFASGLVLANPAYLTPYDTAAGQLVLLVVGGLLAAGWALLHRMARIRAPERVLAPPAAIGENR